MSQELYDGENQAAKADGTEAASQGSLAGAASGTSGQTVWEEAVSYTHLTLPTSDLV